MRVCRSWEELPPALPHPILSIGNFDGVHRAHRRVLERVVEEAAVHAGTAMALTFDPHPARVVHPGSAPPLLTTLEQRLNCLRELGLSVVVVLPFTTELARFSPHQFAEHILVQRLGVRRVLVGANFRFGHLQSGSVDTLIELGRELGFEVEVIPAVVVRGQTVSSSLIRRLITEGEVARAGRLLGRPFALTGRIRPGAGRGRPLGFPTLNLQPDQECWPARGVYSTEALVEGGVFPAATNVGLRPTFEGSQLVVEAHLLDFSRDLREGQLEIRFYQRLREEKKFSSPEALRTQIERDVARTRCFFRRWVKWRTGRSRPVRTAR